MASQPHPIHNRPLVEQIRHRNLETRWQKCVAVEKGCVPRALSFVFNCSFVLAAQSSRWSPQIGATIGGTLQGLADLSRLCGAKFETLDLSDRPTLKTLKLGKFDKGVLMFWEPYPDSVEGAKGVGHLCAYDHGRIYGVRSMFREATVQWGCRIIPTSVEKDQGQLFHKGKLLPPGSYKLSDIGAIDWTDDSTVLEA